MGGTVIQHEGLYDNSKFVDRATLVELPKIGIHGNTHFLMQDLNNAQLADLLDDWLRSNGL